MSSKAKKILSVDDRGRITLPQDLRNGIDSFLVESEGDGSLHLVPQKSVSLSDAALLDGLKASIQEVRKGATKAMPKEWIED